MKRPAGLEKCGALARRNAWLLLLLSALALTAACQRQGEEPEAERAPGQAGPADRAQGEALAGRLIAAQVESRDRRHVAVEIDHELLADLLESDDREARRPFSTPLEAARRFAPHIGISGGSEFTVVHESPEAEDASGLYIAVVESRGDEGSSRLRLVSQPGEHGEATIWVLNDYSRSVEP